jgi:hypothetical protein
MQDLAGSGVDHDRRIARLGLAGRKPDKGQGAEQARNTDFEPANRFDFEAHYPSTRRFS